MVDYKNSEEAYVDNVKIIGHKDDTAIGIGKVGITYRIPVSVFYKITFFF